MPQNVRYAPATRSVIAAGAVRQMMRRCDFAVKPVNRERTMQCREAANRHGGRAALTIYTAGPPRRFTTGCRPTGRGPRGGREHSRVPRVVDHPPLVNDTMRWAGC